MTTRNSTTNMLAEKQNDNINQRLPCPTTLLMDVEHYFNLLVEQIEDYAIFFLDKEGTIKSWNLGAERIKGYTREEAVEQNTEIFYTQEDVATNRFKVILKTALKNGKYQEEGWRLHKDGSKFWAHILITAIYDKHKNHIGFAKITHDLTEKNKIANDLQKSRDYITSLIQKNEAWEEFSYIVSHDLKEPIRGFKIYLDVLEDELKETTTPLQKTMFGALKKLTIRMNNLLESVLTVARSGMRSTSLATISLNKVIEDSKKTLVALLTDNNVDICIPRPLPDVYGDYHQLESLFQNLIVNAIKYNDKEKKWIEIGWTTVENLSLKRAELHQGLIFYVKDNGCGIDKKYQDIIFQPFKRIPIAGCQNEGTGIGLYIIKKIIERHKGRIWVESTPGIGSTFYFTLNECYE